MSLSKALMLMDETLQDVFNNPKKLDKDKTTRLANLLGLKSNKSRKMYNTLQYLILVSEADHLNAMYTMSNHYAGCVDLKEVGFSAYFYRRINNNLVTEALTGKDIFSEQGKEVKRSNARKKTDGRKPAKPKRSNAREEGSGRESTKSKRIAVVNKRRIKKISFT